MLKFTCGNSYFNKAVKVYTLNLPSGFTCPAAVKCLAFANRQTGKITNGPKQEFRCYSATMERYPAVRAAAWHNFELLKGKNWAEMKDLILASIPPKAKYVRIHGGGDFFSADYFAAWVCAAADRPDVTFWAFTKSVDLWVDFCNLGQGPWALVELPSNLCLQASLGGKHDDLVFKHGLKYAKVFTSWEELRASGLPLDTDDTLAMAGSAPFALIENKIKKHGNVLEAPAGAAEKGQTSLAA